MKRRIALGSMAAALLPGIARGQQKAMPVVGFLSSGLSAGYKSRVATFLQTLRAAGFVEGENVKLEFRWADNDIDRLPALAAELVAARVALIVAAGGGQTALAAKAATSTIPVVFQNGSDPVNLGLVATMNRPGGNVTGITSLSNEMAVKRIELMRDLTPAGSVLGWMQYARNPNRDADVHDIEEAGGTLGRRVVFVSVASGDDLDAAFSGLAQARVGALATSGDPIFSSNIARIVELAARHAIPSVFPIREFVDAGGLVSYGSSYNEIFRSVGLYAGRILKGEKPADLPVLQATKIELVVNMKTAKGLGLTIPPTILARADEVIE